MKRQPYNDLFSDESRFALRSWAEGGCECYVEFEDYEDWLDMAVEDRCQPCMAELALIASDEVERLQHQFDDVRARQSQIIAEIRDLAEANCNTKIIGGAHATLKAIIEIIGVEE